MYRHHAKLLCVLVLLCSLPWTTHAQAQVPSMLDVPVTQVATGGDHSCALTTAGGVKCWGWNGHGQLGDGSTTERHLATDVSGLTSGVVMIALGDQHSCALTTTGGVKCWGANFDGQLGDVSTTDRHLPVDVAGLGSGVVAITAGGAHTCALTTAGAVKCWGWNIFGQLGDGSSTERHAPVAVVGLGSGVAAIAAGLVHTCALRMTGGIQCWGANDDGQLGDGSSTDRLVPTAVSGLGSGVAAIVTGEAHTCALTSAHGMQCWGGNFFGQLGDGSNTDRLVPTEVSGLGSGVAAIAAGSSHSCALTMASGMKCWGDNDDGQLGDGSTTSDNSPVDVAGLASGTAAISAGGNHSCALTTGGGLQCWGDNGNGQLGDGSTTDRHLPIDVRHLASGVVAIATGWYHSCALTTAGGVKCWGRNNHGQLGDGSNTNSNTSVDVVGIVDGVAAISAGGDHNCALTTAGGLKCWGDNGNGQLGDGTTTDSLVPVDVVGLTNGVVAIAAGLEHTCALTTAGGVKCWGWNGYGQLGDGTTTNSLVPVDVVGLASGVAAIAAGGGHNCALTTASGVKCWGLNEYGELGDGSNTDRHSPVDVVGLASGVAATSAGGYQNCALTTAGGVKCWGYNHLGQLGDGSTTNRNMPVDVVGLGSGVAAISPGYFYSCALTTAGGAKCWGGNLFGQLGDGSTTDRTTPVDVVGLGSGVAAISAGLGYTCALTTAGGVKCWGGNSFGELGNGDNVDVHVPVDIFAVQSLEFTPPAELLVGDSITLSASASAGGSTPIVFESWTPDTCTVSGNVLTATANALCGVRASRADGLVSPGHRNAAAPQQLRLIRTQSAPTLSLGSNASPAVFGQGVSFIASLADGFAPTGNISFCADATTTDAACSGGTLLCSLPADSVPLQCTTASLGIGSHQISAWFAGDGSNVATASAPLTQIVDKAATAVSVPALGSISYGQPLVVTATLSVVAPGSGTPSGSIEVSAGSASCTINLPAAFCELMPLAIGNLDVTASYAGDAHFLGSNASTPLTVVPALPVAEAQTVTVPPDAATPITLSASDTNPGGPYSFTYAIATPPAHGSLSINGDIATYTPNAGYGGADSFSFTASDVNGTSAPATVDITVTQAVLQLAVGDGRAFARYGQVLDYLVTLRNDGDASTSGVEVTSSASAALDMTQAQWICINGGSGSCSASGSGSLHDIVNLPPGQTLSWLVSVPVRADASDATASFGIAAGTLVAPDDVNVLVIYRDGFEAGQIGATALLPADEDASVVLVLPPPPPDGHDSRIVQAGAAATVRLDRLLLDGTEFLRLRRSPLHGEETASRWMPLAPGSAIAIGRVQSGKQRLILLESASGSLALPLPMPDAAAP